MPPPCLVITPQGQIVHTAGETSLYLQQPTGSPTFNLFDQARKGLRLGLRTAIRQAARTGHTVIHRNLSLQTASGLHTIDLSVRPLPAGQAASRYLVVLFQPAGRPAAPVALAGRKGETVALGQLENELQTMRHELQSTVEELEAANQDLKNSNDQLLAVNERMQLANEELQTSKEEMQSVNKELAAVNTELTRKIEQLDTANADLQNLIRSTEIATLFLDRHLQIRRVTPAASEIFHCLESDRGRPITDLAPHFSNANLVEEMKKVLADRTAYEQPAYLPETQNWYMVRILPSRNVENIIDGLVVTMTNITALKKIEESLRLSEERFRLLVEGVEGYAIYMLDNQGRVVSWNAGAQRMKGYTAAEAIGEDFGHFFPPETPAHCNAQAMLQTARQQERFEGEAWMIRKDSSRLLANVVLTALRDGPYNLLGFSAIEQDITRRKQEQESLAQAMRSAEQAREVAETASKAKDHFLAILSHELRNPLNPVLATASILRDDPQLSPEVHEQLDVICRNTELEARLIDDLLDMTRIERGKIELDRRRNELRHIIRRAVEVCLPDIEAKKIHFRSDLGPSPLWLEADAARLQQVFWNLLMNAVKFTPESGSVTIQVRRERNQLASVDVTDTGVGLEPEGISRIFNAFEQTKRIITRQFGGLGLGLAISKTLVELHGGQITASSPGPGRGATFRVQLPLLTDQEPASPVAPLGSPTQCDDSTPTPHVRPLQILLVEDHTDTARIMTRWLTSDGHYVRTAGTVTHALELAKQAPFDLLLSDLGLPDGTGLELISALRARGLTMPAVALSGFGQDKDLQACSLAGFQAHLTKPVNLTRLGELIARLA